MRDLQPVDESILDAFLDGHDTGDPWGRTTPGLLSDATDYSSEYLQTRLQILEAAGYIDRLDRGIYEITQSGVDAATDN